MQKSDVHRGIKTAWQYIVECDLGETVSDPYPLAVDGEFRNLILRENANYVTIFSTGLRLSHYNFLLTDYSYFQFSWSAKDNVRYAYYPNPFLTGRESLSAALLKELNQELADEIITLDEYQNALAEEKPEVRVPLIRYENAPDQYVSFQHPCSHFHIGHHAENRWPVNRLLTPQAFTLLILKLYYADAWRRFWKEVEGGQENALEARLIAARRESHLIDDALFSKIEADSFHFS